MTNLLKNNEINLDGQKKQSYYNIKETIKTEISMWNYKDKQLIGDILDLQDDYEFTVMISYDDTIEIRTDKAALLIDVHTGSVSFLSGDGLEDLQKELQAIFDIDQLREQEREQEWVDKHFALESSHFQSKLL